MEDLNFIQLETGGKAYDSVVMWISMSIMSAKQRIDQYSAIKPQTADTKYYLEYYKELLSICQSDGQNVVYQEAKIKENEEISHKMSDYKWVII